LVRRKGGGIKGRFGAERQEEKQRLDQTPSPFENVALADLEKGD